jgi:cytoskeleton protein RodZ
MMDKLPNNEIAVSALDVTPTKSAGKMLSEARTLQGLSVADVAGRIKFAPRQVEALETDNYEQLPELAFVRGFVRSYARLLHLDEVVILDALPQTTKQNLPLKNLAEVAFPTAQSARRINVIWLSAALGLAVLLGIGMLFFHEKPANKKVLDAKAVENTPAVMQAPVQSAVEVASSVVGVAAENNRVEHESEQVTSVKPNLKVAQTESINSPIHLVFQTDAWVDIKDKNGNTLFKQVSAAGSEHWAKGLPPFSLVIGNASGVRLYYEGDEIDLKEFTDVEVARLILE